MNPLAFEPTDMDIVALYDNVSCDVEPLVRLLIDMKSKHAGLFGELMPALETALSRNSTKLVDVITRIFGGAKDIDKLFDENMFKAPMSNEWGIQEVGGWRERPEGLAKIGKNIKKLKKNIWK